MSDPSVAPEPAQAAPAPATPAPAARPEDEGFFHQVTAWYDEHVRPLHEDHTGAITELEHAASLHAQQAAGVAKVATGVLGVLKEVAPNAAALPEIEAAVAEVARIAGELATVL